MRDSSPPATPDPAETAAADLFARVLHRTLTSLHKGGHVGASYRALAERVGSPYQHVGEWCQPLSGRVPKVTKVLRMGVRVAPAVLRALAAELEGSGARSVDLRDAAIGVQESAGRLARAVRDALADGVITDEEDGALEAVLLTAEADIAAVRAARAQHRARRSAA